MKVAALLGLLAVPSFAAPGALDFERLVGAARAAGFAFPAAAGAPWEIAVPATPTRPVRPFQEGPMRVDLSGLIDRHMTLADSFNDRVGRHFIAVTLDQTAPDGAWISIMPPGEAARMVLIEAGMKGRWSAGDRTYKVNMDVNIFRARLNNIIEIRDADTDELLWSKRIIQLMSTSYFSGAPVIVAGRPYRLFLAHMPDVSRRPAPPSAVIGLCLIYDEIVDGKHSEYQTYRFMVDVLQRPEGSVVSLFEGDRVRLKVSEDLSSLDISARLDAGLANL